MRRGTEGPREPATWQSLVGSYGQQKIYESSHEHAASVYAKNAARLVWDQSLISMAPRSHGQYGTAEIGFL